MGLDSSAASAGGADGSPALAVGKGPSAKLPSRAHGGAGGRHYPRSSDTVQRGAECWIRAVHRQFALGSGKSSNRYGHGPYWLGPVGISGGLDCSGRAFRFPLAQISNSL